MQVNETKNEGLSREYSITVSASDIGARIDEKLVEISQTIKMPGFRPGKVPMNILRQRYSQNVLGEVIEAVVQENSTKVISDNELRPAMQPRINIESYDEGQDLVFTVGVESMPEIDFMDFTSIKLDRKVAKIDDSEVDEALVRIAKDFRKSEPISEDRAVAKGEVAVIDFLGSVDGVEFEGGKGENYNLEIGSGTFIPGFEDQVEGKKAGDKTDVNVTFPEDYHSADLAGKDAVFAVEVKEVRAYVDQEIDDEFATQLGLDDLAALKEQVRERLAGDYGQIARNEMKRELLDILHEGHTFDVPAGMVDMEFDQIWQQFEQAKDNDQIDEEDKEKSDDELKAEYRDIAARRVTLGLLLSEVGTKAEIEVTQDEVNRAIIQEAQRFPGQEMQVFEYYQKNEQAQASLRAPLFEDKVIDHIIDQADVTEQEIPVAELVGSNDSEEEAKEESAKETKPAKKESKATKKTRAKKAASKKSRAKKAETPKEAAKEEGE